MALLVITRVFPVRLPQRYCQSGYNSCLDRDQYVLDSRDDPDDGGRIQYTTAVQLTCGIRTYKRLCRLSRTVLELAVHLDYTTVINYPYIAPRHLRPRFHG